MLTITITQVILDFKITCLGENSAVSPENHKCDLLKTDQTISVEGFLKN